MKYTKGPWKIDDIYGLILAGEDEICALHSGNKANARLIAAAPEMLEALEAVVRQMEYQTSAGLSSRDSGIGGLALLIEKIIAKARGEK